MRFPSKKLPMILLFVFLLPLLLRAAVYYASERPGGWWDAAWSSARLLAPAAADPAAPELDVALPPEAIGKDFRADGTLFGLTESGTGVEASLWGLLGLKLGWVEGLEVNLLSLVAGLDIRRPAVKLPGFGRIGIESS